MAKKFFGDVELKAALQLSAQTASRALELDGSGNVISSSVTSTELGHLSGVTSAIQTQLDAKVDDSEKGAANGVATLDGSGKLPSSQLPTSATEYKGAWNASTNSPALADGAGINGDLYRVSVSGSQDLGSGSISFVAGDAIIYNGSIWEKIPGEDIIQSVNGATGVVVLDTGDIAENGNLYYTQARFDSAFTAKSTTDLSEGTNLYYTQARFDSAFTAKSTTDLSEGTNLYYTQARFDSAFAAKSAADLAYTPAVLANWTGSVDPGDTDDALDQLASRLATVEGGSTDTKQLLVSANDTTEGYLEDKVVVSSGSNSVNILEISTLNDGANEDLQIQIDEAKINHDNLLGFVANEHIDHSSVNINTNADSGLSGGGDITASRSLSVDIAGTTAETILANDDELLIQDTSAGALRSTTLQAIREHSKGDILETSFAGAQSAAGANVTNFAFANADVRAFTALASVKIDATADLFEEFTIEGIQKGSGWDIFVSSVGDDTSVTFNISAAGQITYSSSTYAGFVSMAIKFRALTLSI